jgi:hypothetical protein
LYPNKDTLKRELRGGQKLAIPGPTRYFPIIGLIPFRRGGSFMRRTLLASVSIAVLALGTAAVLPVSHAVAAPQPSVVPVSWELTFKHGPVERLVTPVEGKNKTFWFMRYTVSNNSGRDILFTPDFQLMTDTGQVTEAFKNVPNPVFEKVKALYKNPLLLSPNNILGKLLQGDDNAKDGVIIFGDVDPNGRQFQIFVSGLSGETAEVKNPVTNESVILQKTLILDYAVPGQAIGINPQPKLTGTHWVMK